MHRLWLIGITVLAAATLGVETQAQSMTTVWIAYRTTAGCIYYRNNVVNGTVEENAAEIRGMVNAARSARILETWSGACQAGKPINGAGMLSQGVSSWTGNFVDGVPHGPIKIRGMPQPTTFNMGCATNGYNGTWCTPHAVGGRTF